METSNHSDLTKYLNRNIQCYFTSEDCNLDSTPEEHGKTIVQGKQKTAENVIKDKLRKTGRSFRKCVKAVLGKNKKNTKTTQNTKSSTTSENYSIPRQSSSCELSSVLNNSVDDEDIPSASSTNAILEINDSEALGGKIFQKYIGQISVAASKTETDADSLLTIDINRVKDLESNIDIYVQVSLLDYTMTETLACNTSTVSSESHPVLEEKFSYELMPDDYFKRVFISVWRADSKNEEDEFIGCTSFGVKNIVEKRNTVNGWYYLLDDSIGERKHVQVKDKISGDFTEDVGFFSQDSVSSGYGSCASNT